MKIALFTNTYLPHCGGVARSVHTLEDACRRLGHEVKVIAPEFEGAEDSPHVVRVPAIQNFNGSDFSVRLPFSHLVQDCIANFQPDLIHSHHPFLLGDSALRQSWTHDIPLVFTHHTMYERYTHYVPLDSPALKRAVIQLDTEYCQRCDQVVAPSESVARLLEERGVTTPVEVIPTGIDVTAFGAGDGARCRRAMAIPPDARVIGHVGRLAEEKNLPFLAGAVARCLRDDPGAVFLLVGDGQARDKVLQILQREAKEEQLFLAGELSGSVLADAYAAIDYFTFASQSETQGLVLAEAMASATPVVALDGPGVREIVRGGTNGILLDGNATSLEFASALAGLMRDREQTQAYGESARKTAECFATDRCIRKMLDCYDRLVSENTRDSHTDPEPWNQILLGLEVEWEILVAKATAAAATIMQTPAVEAQLD